MDSRNWFRFGLAIIELLGQNSPRLLVDMPGRTRSKLLPQTPRYTLTCSGVHGSGAPYCDSVGRQYYTQREIYFCEEEHNPALNTVLVTVHIDGSGVLVHRMLQPVSQDRNNIEDRKGLTFSYPPSGILYRFFWILMNSASSMLDFIVL